ncbi:hypothetical protein [Polluticaenibacter yanchengensis]|uniref:DUF2306 domain-containing protein n=1 Tax=Polluticaenibacter yanchengensis TaxID=3014562 RepID=A0ABT4UKY2_9BACT|nr:hypothetical protein [Chitinophagaceae bacterium LY-5]
MEKKYKILILFFVMVVVISLSGFMNTYLKYFPDTQKFPLLIHIHFAAFLSWFAMILIQPILIKQKRYALHRKIGRLSYFIAPVIVITILLLVKAQVQRELSVPENSAPVTALIGLLDVVSFSLYYTIAMINKQNTRWHVAFLIAASLIVLNPGMSRLFNQLQPGLGLLAAIILPFIVPLIIIFFEKIKLNRPVFKNPYFIFLCGWSLEIVLFITIPNTEYWKSFVVNTMKLF